MNDLNLPISGQTIALFRDQNAAAWLTAKSFLQPVAIKEMLNTDRKAKADFLKEIKLLKHVSLDANIVQYLGACFQEDRLWLVTEYMEVRGAAFHMLLCSHALTALLQVSMLQNTSTARVWSTRLACARLICSVLGFSGWRSSQSSGVIIGR